MRKRSFPLSCCFLLLGLAAAPGAEFSLEDAMRRLGHAEFKARVAAQDELSDWGKEHMEKGIEIFYQGYRTSEDPEVRMRCRELLKELVVISQSGEGEGYIGIMMQEDKILRPGAQGEVRSAVRITAVLKDTPAEKAALRIGDLVTGIDDLELEQEGATERFGAYVRSKSPKTSIKLHVLRDGKPLDLDVELMRRPKIAERNWLLWGDELKPPSRDDSEEEQFRDWLKKRLAEENTRK